MYPFSYVECMDISFKNVFRKNSNHSIVHVVGFYSSRTKFTPDISEVQFCLQAFQLISIFSLISALENVVT